MQVSFTGKQLKRLAELARNADSEDTTIIRSQDAEGNIKVDFLLCGVPCYSIIDKQGMAIEHHNVEVV